MKTWKRWISWPVAAILFVGLMALVMRAQEKPPAMHGSNWDGKPEQAASQVPDPNIPTPPKPPTIEELQKQITEKDAQIAQLQAQVAGLKGNLAALNKLYGACYQSLSADEAALVAKK